MPESGVGGHLRLAIGESMGGVPGRLRRARRKRLPSVSVQSTRDHSPCTRARYKAIARVGSTVRSLCADTRASVAANRGGTR